VTLEQIKQLIQEEFPHRRNRHRRRVYHDEEEEWSDNSTWSWDSRSQPQQTNGGNDQRFYGVKDETHLNKSEFQPEPPPSIDEVLVSQFDGDDYVSMMEMKEEQGTTVEEKESNHTIRCEGISSTSLKILTNLLLEPELTDRKGRIEKTEMQSMDGVMQELPKLPALPPPSKLPETDMLVDIGEVQTTPIQNVPTQMSEPLDCGQPETVLPRRCPPPKPPDLGDSENGKGHQETEANLLVSIGKMEVPPEGTHDREVLAMFNTYS
ncbi:hypothetical protein L195_g053800, partial [Trifolium pratense]